jgi:hypothetical protein
MRVNFDPADLGFVSSNGGIAMAGSEMEKLLISDVIFFFFFF